MERRDQTLLEHNPELAEIEPVMAKLRKQLVIRTIHWDNIAAEAILRIDTSKRKSWSGDTDYFFPDAATWTKVLMEAKQNKQPVTIATMEDKDGTIQFLGFKTGEDTDTQTYVHIPRFYTPDNIYSQKGSVENPQKRRSYLWGVRHFADMVRQELSRDPTSSTDSK